MARLLSLFMIFALVLTQGSSMAAAVCRHQNAHEHLMARQSQDAKVAAVSLGEEAAAAAVVKKASHSSDASGHWPAEMLPPRSEAVPLPSRERIVFQPPRQARLLSANIAPLLKPPSA